MSEVRFPRDVECPHCGAKVDHGCFSDSLSGRWAAKTHAKRWKAIGVAKPDVDDWHRAYLDGKKRDGVLLDAAYRTQGQTR